MINYLSLSLSLAKKQKAERRRDRDREGEGEKVGALLPCFKGPPFLSSLPSRECECLRVCVCVCVCVCAHPPRLRLNLGESSASDPESVVETPRLITLWLLSFSLSRSPSLSPFSFFPSALGAYCLLRPYRALPSPSVEKGARVITIVCVPLVSNKVVRAKEIRLSQMQDRDRGPGVWGEQFVNNLKSIMVSFVHVQRWIVLTAPDCQLLNPPVGLLTHRCAPQEPQLCRQQT